MTARLVTYIGKGPMIKSDVTEVAGDFIRVYVDESDVEAQEDLTVEVDVPTDRDGLETLLNGLQEVLQDLNTLRENAQKEGISE